MSSYFSVPEWAEYKKYNIDRGKFPRLEELACRLCELHGLKPVEVKSDAGGMTKRFPFAVMSELDTEFGSQSLGFLQ